jgi:hypothetical protein
MTVTIENTHINFSYIPVCAQSCRADSVRSKQKVMLPTVVGKTVPVVLIPYPSNGRLPHQINYVVPINKALFHSFYFL